MTPPMLKDKEGRDANCAAVRRSKPVLLSKTAPVAFWYRANASMIHKMTYFANRLNKISVLPAAMRISVMRVSTTPAVSDKMVVEPSLID